jgi:hypothetical protein
MPLETGTTIEDLDSSYPLGGDSIARGDDHLRLIKAVLKTQFPGANGNGFAQPINATETELNYSQGLTGNIQAQLDALDARISDNETAIGQLTQTLPAPSGTELLFTNTAPPLGWTQRADLNDYMLRIVSGTGAGTGGTDSPILNDKVPSHTHNTSSAGAHSHGASNGQSFFTRGPNQAFFGGIPGEPFAVVARTSTEGDHTHTVDANAGAANWEPQYINTIIGIKD